MKFITIFSLAILLIFFIPAQIALGQESSVIKLIPTDDSFVVTDRNDPLNTKGIDDLQFGNESFLKIWYSNNTTANQEEIISLGYLKFDVSELNSDEIVDTKLKMFAYLMNKTALARSVNIHVAPESSWDESGITFVNRPIFSPEPIATSLVSEIGKWYTWDVTATIKKYAGSEATLIVLLEKYFPNSAEQIVFYSKDANDQKKAPHIEITYLGVAPIASTFESESDLDYTFVAIIVGLVAAAIGIGILFLLIKQKKDSISKKSGKVKLSFVDPNKGSKHYIRRYLKEPKYKAWFDRNYPSYKIYEAVGLSEQEYAELIKELESE